jgi:transcription-repair coupling factor (superfamily II helicase)
VRPDMKVVFFADWERPDDRLKGAARILSGLVRIAEPAKAA